PGVPPLSHPPRFPPGGLECRLLQRRRTRRARQDSIDSARPCRESSPARRFPDLLATKRGRMAAFFLLYMTEGIPLGFAATAVATQMRRRGVGPAEIGAFVGSLYLPWAFKWAVGPVVDTLTVARFGR